MKISLIVPIYNEELCIDAFYKEVKQKLGAYNLEVVFIDDGSVDNSLNILEKIASSDLEVKIISFTRNFGKESALFAGLEVSTGDAVIPIDVDLQDPIDVIPKLIEKWQQGADIVLAKRIDRSSDTFIKRKTAEWFYMFHNKVSEIKIEENVGDFRLLSREIVDNIKKLTEKNLFMKGILSWVGGKIDVIEYQREKRVAGKSKFNGWRLWNLALDGITNFSTIPLRIWTYVGLLISVFSFFYGFILIIDKLLFGNNVPGYSSLIISILFLGGVQLIGIGILGEYLGRVYLEIKNRPRYIIKRKRLSEK